MKKSILVTLVFLVSLPLMSIAQNGAQYPLKVGAAKIDVTPKGEPTAPATGKYDHERAYVRAIVIDNGVTRAAFITMEGRIPLDESVMNQLTAELNCPKENIIITGTHSHSVSPTIKPAGSQVSNATPQPAALNPVLDVVRKAKASLQPARMGYGKGMCYLNVNRNQIDPDTRNWTQGPNLDGPSDKSVDVIKFETLTGEPIAAYVSYAMHPVNGYAMNIFSADFPGAASRYVEKAFGDKMIMEFSQGASGDQNPLYMRPSTNAMASMTGIKVTGYEFSHEIAEGPLRSKWANNSAPPDPKATRPVADQKLLDDMFRFIESEGQILGEEIIRVMSLTRNLVSEARIESNVKLLTCPAKKRTDGNNPWQMNRDGIDATYEDAPDVQFHIRMLGIGNVVIANTAQEVFSYIGIQVKKESPVAKTMFVTCTVNVPADKRVGYVPNDAAFGEKTFQVLDTQLKPGCAERAIVNGIVSMVDQYIDK